MSFIFFFLACRSYGKGYIDVVQESDLPEDSAIPVEPTSEPESSPTSEPTSEPTSQPDSEPESTPTSEPTSEPESSPTSEPTSEPESSPTSEPEPSGDMLNTWSESKTSDPNGFLEVEIDIPADATSILITSESQEYIFVDRFMDPTGSEVFNWSEWGNSSEFLTMAIYPDQVNVFNWPIRDSDPGLSAGTWTLHLYTLQVIGDQYYYAGNVPVDLRIQYKTDTDLTQATVTARIVYADGVQNNSEVVSAVSQAVSYWSDVWSAANITLIHDTQNNSIDATLPFPGDPSITQVATTIGDDELLVIIGETIADEDGILGIAGGIPGSLVDTQNSVMMVSWLNNAGPDGEFDGYELEMFGLTMAHEIGHYMGLFHPVEIELNGWDALDDTAYCTEENQCENQLGTNLMFPYPVFQSNGMLGIKELSPDQQGVLHRYTGAL